MHPSFPWEREDKERLLHAKKERRVWGEALRLGRTGYSDAVMGWIHVLTLRVFVETVLRYGLPLSYVCGLIKVGVKSDRFGESPMLTWPQTDQKRAKKAKASLDARFSDLGGNAMSRDKKGRAVKDDATLQQEMAGAGLNAEQGYEPYVFYEFELI